MFKITQKSNYLKFDQFIDRKKVVTSVTLNKYIMNICFMKYLVILI
jgi:hypothetical protein